MEKKIKNGATKKAIGLGTKEKTSEAPVVTNLTQKLGNAMKTLKH